MFLFIIDRSPAYSHNQDQNGAHTKYRRKLQFANFTQKRKRKHKGGCDQIQNDPLLRKHTFIAGKERSYWCKDST